MASASWSTAVSSIEGDHRVHRRPRPRRAARGDQGHADARKEDWLDLLSPVTAPARVVQMVNYRFHAGDS
jgi:hypothetical protein